MDISKLKELAQSVFKNYSSLLVPAAIGLAAVVVFIPTQLMSGKLRSEMKDTSIRGIGTGVKRLNNRVVSREQYKEEAEYQRRLKNEANDVWLLAQRTTQRELLSYKIFPEPKDASSLIFRDFGRQFRSGVEELLGRSGAVDCPSKLELDMALQGLSGPGIRRSKRSGFRRVRVPQTRVKEAKETIIDALCRGKAESARVYANPVDVSGYQFWEGYELPERNEAIKDCWYWQLAYWITQDVIDTIEVLNSGSESVLTSPVKRLVAISFGGQIKKPRPASGSKAAESRPAEKPNYVLSLEDALAWPCTGRYCSTDIDVVHFNVVVVVSAKDIFSLMQELCSVKEHRFRGWDGQSEEAVYKHNQITILDSKADSINREDDAEHKYYRYGQDAVVELTLICEYVLNTAGYEIAAAEKGATITIKPKAVVDDLKERLQKLEAEKAKADRTKRRKERKTKAKTSSGKKGFGSRRSLPEI
jgi:hypothetical protein